MGNERQGRKCWHCGRDLTAANAWMAESGFEAGGPSFYCVGCQSSFHRQLATLTGPEAADFICCAMFNVPFVPEAWQAAERYKAERGVWGGYVAALRSAKYHKAGDRWPGFAEGETDLRRALEAQYGDLDISTADEAAANAAEQRLLDETRWGRGPKSRGYKDDDYAELNRIYEAMTKDRAGLSDQAQVSIVNICKWMLERDRCVEAKEFGDAQKLSQMIEREKESEQLRKKDEMPQDNARIDDIVKAVERAGLNMYDYEELKRQLATYMFHSPYGITRDAADQMLLLIRNCTAWNEGMPEVDRLGDEFAVMDHMGEFAPEPDDKEKELYRALQLNPLHMGGDVE